ncbi:MAG: DUF445 domain-containing protein [Sphingobacteriia bacterium]
MRSLLPFLRTHFVYDDLVAEARPATLPPASPATSGPLPRRLRFRLFLLRVVPWLCMGLLALSFVWDFPTQRLLGLPLLGLLRMLAVSGLIGYFTNWLAIKMLFYPRRRRPLMGQGLVPAQQHRLARRLAESIHQHLMNEQALLERLQERQLIRRVLQRTQQGLQGLADDIAFAAELRELLLQALRTYLADPAVQQQLVAQLDASIRDAMEGQTLAQWYLQLNRKKYQQSLQRLVQQLPGRSGQWLGDPALVLRLLSDELDANADMLAGDITHLLRTALAGLNIPGMLEHQLASFESSKLEQMLWGSTNEQLKYIEYLGGWLGLLGGLVLWQPLPMLALLGTLLGLWVGADWILLRLRTRSG